MKKEKAKKVGKWALAWALTQPLAYGSMWAIRGLCMLYSREPMFLMKVFVATTWMPWSNEIGLLAFAGYKKWRARHDKAIDGPHVAHSS